MNNQIQIASEVKNSSRTSTLAHETRKNKKWLSMLVIAALAVTAAFTSCGGGSGSSGGGKGIGGSGGGNGIIIMKQDGAYLRLILDGTGNIDWGDGVSEKYEFGKQRTKIEHDYPVRAERTITITGKNITDFNCSDLNITSLDLSKNTALVALLCSNNALTSLDLSKNTKLVELYCKRNKITSLDVSNCSALTFLECSLNHLTSLDLSKNTALNDLRCGGNDRMTKSAMEALYGTLHSNAGDKYITILYNSAGGTDVSIAEKKGWIVKRSEFN